MHSSTDGWIDEDGDRRIRELTEQQTIPQLFRATVERRADEPSHRWRSGEGWAECSWREYGDGAARTATLIQSAGIAPRETVALMLRNCPEFHRIDMGAHLAATVPFSIYNSSSPEQIAYLLEHSEARLVFAEPMFAPQLEAAVAQLSTPVEIILVGSGDADSWEQRITRVEPVDLADAAARVQPNDLATFIYTSGTTGPPKAVKLTHANVCWLLQSLVELLGFDLAGRRMLSYLPMAHVAERVFTHYLPAREGALVTPCPSPAEVGAYLVEVRPEAFFGPPRVFEKMRAGLIGALSATPEGAAALERGLDVGRRMFEARSTGVEPDAATAEQWQQVDQALFAAVRARVGFDACQVALTGAAPPPVEVIEFFNFIGVSLSEVYGLSEDTGLMTAEVRRPRAGTVGRPIPGCSVRLLEDGEILCRGGHVFGGYFKDPEKTAEVLDEDGWLHTGDIGVMEDDGYIRIIDRKKELIITAGGKNISPANIEAQLKQLPLIAEACVIGDRRPYVTAVLTLDPDGARAWAAENGVEPTSLRDLTEHPGLLSAVERSIATVNERLSNVERVKKFHLAADEWAPDSDVLTPTMKLKRRGVVARYEAAVEALYSG